MRKRIRKWAALMMAMVLTGLPGAFAAVPTVSLLEGEILQEQEDGSFLLQSLSMGRSW